ncbi:MAG: alpha-ribazole phosphatase [Miltoncostaeaceae bacterium]|nr:alpha-ribazole phosphatase [Miltoncostaeaceae bacterium]
MTGGAVRVVAVRHAAVGPAAAGRWAGCRFDPDADPAALWALRPTLLELARAHPPARVVASPSRRARQTAALLGRPVEVDARLAERDFGDWEGLSIAECLATVDPDALADAERYLAIPIPGAEPAASVLARGRALWEELAAAQGVVWCVGHGGSVRALIAAARGVSLAEAFRRPLPPGAVVLLPQAGGPAGA